MSDKKTIFITGASSGIGKATAKLFQSNGWNVIATMRNPEKETELPQLGNITLLSLDVTDKQQIKNAVTEALSLREVDVVFNNAGYGMTGPMESYTDEQITNCIDTDLLGAIRVTHAFIPYFRERRRGLFITTTSFAGLVGVPLNSIYSAAKWGLEGWSEALSYELNAFGVGIKTISPGGTKTDFLGRSLDSNSHEAYQALANKLYASFNVEDFNKAQDVAEIVYEVATDDKDQLRYTIGKGAEQTLRRRREIGAEAFRKEYGRLLFGD